jgi:hypothetical protein
MLKHRQLLLILLILFVASLGVSNVIARCEASPPSGHSFCTAAGSGNSVSGEPDVGQGGKYPKPASGPSDDPILRKPAGMFRLQTIVRIGRFWFTNVLRFRF